MIEVLYITRTFVLYVLVSEVVLYFSGMNKIIINHIDKLFVTSDCSTIMNELDVYHPAAKLVVMAAKSQQQEIGDGTNTVSCCSGSAVHFIAIASHASLYCHENLWILNMLCIKSVLCFQFHRLFH